MMNNGMNDRAGPNMGNEVQRTPHISSPVEATSAHNLMSNQVTQSQEWNGVYFMPITTQDAISGTTPGAFARHGDEIIKDINGNFQVSGVPGSMGSHALGQVVEKSITSSPMINFPTRPIAPATQLRSSRLPPPYPSSQHPNGLQCLRQGPPLHRGTSQNQGEPDSPYAKIAFCFTAENEATMTRTLTEILRDVEQDIADLHRSRPKQEVKTSPNVESYGAGNSSEAHVGSRAPEQNEKRSSTIPKAATHSSKHASKKRGQKRKRTETGPRPPSVQQLHQPNLTPSNTTASNYQQFQPPGQLPDTNNSGMQHLHVMNSQLNNAIPYNLYQTAVPSVITQAELQSAMATPTHFAWNPMMSSQGLIHGLHYPGWVGDPRIPAPYFVMATGIGHPVPQVTPGSSTLLNPIQHHNNFSQLPRGCQSSQGDLRTNEIGSGQNLTGCPRERQPTVAQNVIPNDQNTITSAASIGSIQPGMPMGQTICVQDLPSAVPLTCITPREPRNDKIPSESIGYPSPETGTETMKHSAANRPETVQCRNSDQFHTEEQTKEMNRANKASEPEREHTLNLQLLQEAHAASMDQAHLSATNGHEQGAKEQMKRTSEHIRHMHRQTTSGPTSLPLTYFSSHGAGLDAQKVKLSRTNSLTGTVSASKAPSTQRPMPRSPIQATHRNMSCHNSGEKVGGHADKEQAVHHKTILSTLKVSGRKGSTRKVKGSMKRTANQLRSSVARNITGNAPRNAIGTKEKTSEDTAVMSPSVQDGKPKSRKRKGKATTKQLNKSTGQKARNIQDTSHLQRRREIDEALSHEALHVSRMNNETHQASPPNVVTPFTTVGHTKPNSNDQVPELQEVDINGNTDVDGADGAAIRAVSGTSNPSQVARVPEDVLPPAAEIIRRAAATSSPGVKNSVRRSRHNISANNPFRNDNSPRPMKTPTKNNTITGTEAIQGYSPDLDRLIDPAPLGDFNAASNSLVTSFPITTGSAPKPQSHTLNNAPIRGGSRGAFSQRVPATLQASGPAPVVRGTLGESMTQSQYQTHDHDLHQDDRANK